MVLARRQVPIPEGSFGIIIDGNVLRVPQRLVDFLAEQGVKDPDEYLIWLSEHAEFMCKVLDWCEDGYARAVEELRAQMLARAEVA